MFQRHRATPSFTYGMTNMFRIGDFDFSFLIQGVQGGFSVTTSLLHRDNLRHGIEQNTGSCLCHPANLCPASDSIYLILLCGISARNRFCIITEWRFIRRNRWAARPLGKDSVSETENCSKYPVRRSFVSPHASERLAIKANPNFPNLIRQSWD